MEGHSIGLLCGGELTRLAGSTVFSVGGIVLTSVGPTFAESVNAVSLCVCWLKEVQGDGVRMGLADLPTTMF